MARKTPLQPAQTDFLASLVLWRNDHSLIMEIKPHADAGNPHAQYALGLIYAEGRGVPVDRVAAYAWLTLAMSQGDDDAALLRDMLVNSMSKTELDQAEQRLALV